MKKNLLLVALAALFSVVSYAQDEPAFGIKFSGYVKTDVLWDSRQTISIRNGHFLLFPANESLDAKGDDINAKSNFNMLSIQSRLHGTITGPDAFGAKTSGAIEGEFFGHSDGDVNEFRLRHAFVKLDWTHSQLLVGQYWHPLFVTSCYPGTVSFNTGAPFLPFTRNPQIRFTHTFNQFKLMLTAISQVDFVSNGPDGPNSKYLRNSVLPAMNLRFEYGAKYASGNEVLFGISGNYKMLTPKLVTPNNYKTDTKASSYLGMAYFKYILPGVTFKLAGIYGQDAYNLTMLGGYAVEKITDTLTGKVDYTPVSTMSVWTDIHTNKKEWQLGLFAGYTQNQGAASDIGGDNYSRGANIKYAYRIAPRFIYNTGKFRLAPEIEYTVAAYGTTQVDGTVKDTKEIGNVRFLLGIYYFF